MDLFKWNSIGELNEDGEKSLLIGWLGWDSCFFWYEQEFNISFRIIQACELKQKGDEKCLGGLWKNIHMIKKTL